MLSLYTAEIKEYLKCDDVVDFDKPEVKALADKLFAEAEGGTDFVIKMMRESKTRTELWINLPAATSIDSTRRGFEESFSAGTFYNRQMTFLGEKNTVQAARLHPALSRCSL